MQEQEKRETRREAALERHKHLSALFRTDRLGFERERRRMIHELIESAEDEALKKKLLDFQANWDRKMEGAGSQHNRFIKAKSPLDELSQSYPTPRKKHDVPFWFYVASNFSMRLHGAHAFEAFPMVVRAGGLLPLPHREEDQENLCVDSSILLSCYHSYPPDTNL